jgi:Ring finger domain/SWIM zinc finger
MDVAAAAATISSTSVSATDSSSDFPPGESLSRKELQKYLKSWKCKAVGTTDSLRVTYETMRAVNSAVVPPTSDIIPPSTESESGSAMVLPSEASSFPSEKRLRKYRSTPTLAIRQRIDRARTQRLYLVERSDVTVLSGSSQCSFVVLGSTGNVYKVDFGPLPRCSCPDHKRGNLCKHILFVLLKVIGLDPQSPLVYQSAYLETELQQIFALMTCRRVGGSVMASGQVRESYASLKSEDEKGHAVEGVNRKSLDDDADCPICFDTMEPGASLAYCRAACGTNFHSDCIQRWLGQGKKGAATCPNCRQTWQSEVKPYFNMSYTNLGALQGQGKKRKTTNNTSTSEHSEESKRPRFS